MYDELERLLAALSPAIDIKCAQLRQARRERIRTRIFVLLCALGLGFGAAQWIHSVATGVPASSGTVMLAALPLIIGIQFLIAFLHHDVDNVPREPLSAALARP